VCLILGLAPLVLIGLAFWVIEFVVKRADKG
jgi:hypothetical protein